jgi:hypothetical protein
LISISTSSYCPLSPHLFSPLLTTLIPPLLTTRLTSPLLITLIPSLLTSPHLASPQHHLLWMQICHYPLNPHHTRTFTISAIMSRICHCFYICFDSYNYYYFFLYQSLQKHYHSSISHRGRTVAVLDVPQSTHERYRAGSISQRSGVRPTPKP